MAPILRPRSKSGSGFTGVTWPVMVPHLATALTGPLLALEKRFLDNETAI